LSISTAVPEVKIGKAFFGLGGGGAIVTTGFGGGDGGGGGSLSSGSDGLALLPLSGAASRTACRHSSNSSREG
jgi:hypothetical protein